VLSPYGVMVEGQCGRLRSESVVFSGCGIKQFQDREMWVLKKLYIYIYIYIYIINKSAKLQGA
jgi:hypothetical protein